MTRDDLDKLCDFHARRVFLGLGPMKYLNVDTFVNWVAELGRREGEWMLRPPERKAA
jgi:hypothetical protein